MKRDTEADLLLQGHLRERGIRFDREFRFHSARKWRLDYFCHVGAKVPFAIEIEGGAFSRGRHTRGKGFEADCTKYNSLAINRVPLLRFTTGQIKRGEDIPFLREFQEKS